MFAPLLVVALLSAGQLIADPSGPIFTNPATMGFATRTIAPFGSSGDAPTCLGDPTCKGFCGVGVYDGGTEWQCVAGPASALGAGVPVAVTQGTGATYAGSPFEQSDAGAYLAASDITDAKAPSVAAAAAQAWLGSTFWSGDHSLVVATLATSATAAAPVAFSNATGSVSGFYMQVYSDALHCRYQTPGDVGAIVSASPHGEWSILSCIRSGGNITARVNGSAATTPLGAAVNPSTSALFFGRFNDVGFPIRGPLWRVYFYGAAKSSSELAAIEAGIWGAYTNRGPITTVRSGSATATLADGVTYTWGDNAPRVDPRYGILSTVAAGDINAISTSGWPVTRGSISFDLTPIAVPTATNIVLDSRTSFPGDGVAIYYDQNGVYAQVNGGNQLGGPVTGAATWTAGVTYHVRLDWDGASGTLYRNGASLGSGTVVAPTAHRSAAGLGVISPALGLGNQADAYLKNLCVGAIGRCP